MKSVRLILADIHQLEPFSVRSYQFSSRAGSFARFWTGNVELWLPGPPSSREVVQARIGSTLPDNLSIEFGPEPFVELLGKRWASRGRFRRWCQARLKTLRQAGERCIFYFRTLKLAEFLRPAIKAAGWQYAFEPHELFHESSPKPDDLKAIEDRVYREAARLFPITRALEGCLKATFPEAAPTTVSPLGHSGRNFEIPPYDPAAAPSFLYIGSLHRWKGLETALDATAGLKTPFHVVGDAGGLERCRAFCAERGHTHSVFHGQVPPENLASFYEPGSICLLPLSQETIARSYTSPLKLFEYLAAGRPVAAADLPSVREIVRDGEEACLIPAASVPDWRNRLESLLSHRDEAARLAANGRALAHACTWDNRARDLIEVLRHAV